MNNTKDFSKFGYREKDMAGDLLKALGSRFDKTRFFEDVGTSVEFNPMSGCVFLVNENYDVAMMNGDNLEDFFSCPECGHEGFLEEMEHGEDDLECQRYLKSISE